jgi:hypothetical protein
MKQYLAIVAAVLGLVLLAGCSSADGLEPTLPTVATAPVTTPPVPRMERTSLPTPTVQAPKVSIKCPPGSGPPGRVDFGFEWEVWTKQARVTITYGDGKRYSTTQLKHFDSAFWHDYTEPGTFTARVALRDATGQTASDSCSIRIVSPTYVPPRYEPPSYPYDPPRLPNGHIDHDWPTFPGPGSSDRPIQPYPAPPGDPNDRDGDGVACEYGCKN